MRVIFILLLALLLCSCGPHSFKYEAANSSPPQLVVRGEGRVEVTPDKLQLRLGVVTEASEADQALTENNQRMSAVMAMLADIGIVADEMATGQFQIRPEWSLPPRPTPANWQRHIVGYRVSNELWIVTTRVALAGRLLAAAQQAGANQVGGLQFTLADPEAHRQRAITLATAQAVREAQTLAAAAGVTLGPVQSLTLDSPSGSPKPQLMTEARFAGADAVPVAAGKVEVKAAVLIVYRLADGKTSTDKKE
ncbi:MAG: SIMPL domain-containing protein [Desulfuromonadales bacterium]|nr:SIMPL domain-containing protein [Desulfuromonadales bacterium]